jgi:hypothetical protein
MITQSMAEALQSKLADALQWATKLARKHVIRSSALSRGDRELLTSRGYLKEVLKGWYLLTRPIDKEGESTAWYGAFWDFLAVYLEERFGNDYCLSAGSSIDLHTGANVIPRQVIAITARGGKMQLQLPHNTAILVYQDANNLPPSAEIVQGVRAMPLAQALCRIAPSFFENQPVNAEIALRSLKSVDDLIRGILEKESATLASRFVGAYEFLGDQERASQIRDALNAAGINFQPGNPFSKPIDHRRAKAADLCLCRSGRGHFYHPAGRCAGDLQRLLAASGSQSRDLSPAG